MKKIGFHLREHLRSTFLSGLLLIAPLTLTFLILKSFFVSVDRWAQPVARHLWGVSFPGLGILLTLFLLYAIGLVSTNFLGRALVHQGERLLLKIPVIKVVYQSLKEILHAFFGKGGAGFRGRVVLVDYPKEGFKTLAFQTNRFLDRQGRGHRVVLIPTVPNPTNGALAVFRDEEVLETDVELEDACKFFLSAGILSFENRHG